MGDDARLVALAVAGVLGGAFASVPAVVAVWGHRGRGRTGAVSTPRARSLATRLTVEGVTAYPRGAAVEVGLPEDETLAFGQVDHLERATSGSVVLAFASARPACFEAVLARQHLLVLSISCGSPLKELALAGLAAQPVPVECVEPPASAAARARSLAGFGCCRDLAEPLRSLAAAR